MKKLYIKPEAANVVYSVNENISTSAPDGGHLTYIHEGGAGYCNTLIQDTGIESGLQGTNLGVDDTHAVWAYLEKTGYADELWALINAAAVAGGNFACYR